LEDGRDDGDLGQHAYAWASDGRMRLSYLVCGLAGGANSTPPPPYGLHRAIRQSASALPLTAPCSRTTCSA
jgi:hypothetical protein